jgi:hypothetical protein
MNYFEAHKLLNEVKDGTNHPTELITHALYLTGDLEDGMRSSVLHQDIQRNQINQRAGISFWMVGPHNKNY